MSNFDSPISKKSFVSQPQSNEGQLKQFTVGEPEFAEPPLPFEPPTQQRQLSPAEIDQFRKMRQVQEQQRNALDGALKERINYLANIGRLTTQVNLGNSVFSLRTLKNKESKEVSMESIKNAANDIEVGYEARRQILARSIFQIDGVEIEMILGSNDLKSKLDLIDTLEESVISSLYSAFEELRNKANTQFAIKTSDDAKEVVENLKK